MYKVQVVKNDKKIEIEFDIIKKARLKHKYITISGDGVLVKTNKNTSLKDIKEMVVKKSEWILKKTQLFKDNNVVRDSSKLYYLGEKYDIKMIVADNKKVTLEFKDSKFYMTTPLTYSKIEYENTIKNFYKQNAIKQILPMVEKWSKIMQVTPAKVSFRYARKRWGSCSSINNISFNFNLIKLPLFLIEYIVVHELAHIKHHNHSKYFWQCVKFYMDDYKSREEKIRDYEKLF
jgi:predicted metal-dependent hydrolase